MPSKFTVHVVNVPEPPMVVTFTVIEPVAAVYAVIVPIM
jgi:hypothetical protein